MSQTNNLQVDLPFVDKLINDDYKKSNGVSIDRATVSQLRNSIIRDIETLLNSRRQWQLETNSLKELNKSILSYGLPDFFYHFSNIEEAKLRICRQIKHCIQTFEPRLSKVHVESEEETLTDERLVSIKISALINTNFAMESFVVNTHINSVDLSFSIEEPFA